MSHLEELEQRIQSLECLLDVARVLAAEDDVDKVLSAIAQQACQALHCERATVYEFSLKAGELFTRVATDLELEEIRRPITQGISGYVARTKKTLNVPLPSANEHWDSAFDKATGFETRNILATPLLSPRDGSLLGVLQLLNNLGGPFDIKDEALLVAFAQHAAAALDRAELAAELRERQKIEVSLAVAREVQRGFMPKKIIPIPGYDVATWWYPHQAVGGDYCDVLSLSGRRFGLCIADVCGHGIGPSLTMASVRASLRTLLLNYEAPEEVLTRLAQTMYADLEGDSFVTLLFAILDAQHHTLSFANAGHGPALYYDVAKNAFHELKATGMPLGVLEDATYSAGDPLALAPGDIVLLCTDGIVEATNRQGEMFGLSRLETLIRQLASAPIAELAGGIGAEVDRFYLGNSPADDLTILALRRTADVA